MPTVAVPMTVSDPANACCAGCPEPGPRVRYLSNDHGFFTLSYRAASADWSASYSTASENVSDSQADPSRTPGAGQTSCLKPKSGTVSGAVTVRVVVSCPDGTGKWRVRYSAQAEKTFFQWLGDDLLASRCVAPSGPFPVETAQAPAVYADDAGCGPSQTFQSPGASGWVGAGGHTYSAAPDPGVSTLSS